MKKENIEVLTFLKNNLEWLATREIDLFLENNYGAEVQSLYSLFETPKEELEKEGLYTKATIRQAEILRAYINRSLFETLRTSTDCREVEIETTLRNSIEIKKKFYTIFLDNLNGSKENINVLNVVLFDEL